MSMPRLLVARGISKSYSGSVVLDQVDFEVQRGEVVGLVGENGAGKSTLLNILSGVMRPDRGDVLVNDKVVHFPSYHHANRNGVFRVFQESTLIPNLAVYENLLFSHEARFERFGGVLDRRAMRRAAEQILKEAHLDIDVERKTDELTLAQRQALEIARATTLSFFLKIPHPIILLDEPTTALDATDEKATLDLVRRLKGEAAFVFVSHRFEEIFAVTDRIYVLKDGRMVENMPSDRATPELLRSLMVGRESIALDPMARREPTKGPETTRLSVRGLSVPGVLSDMSIELEAHEIVGVCGLAGSGKEVLGPAIIGSAKSSHGTILVDGVAERPTVRTMMARGVVYMPGDRQLDGLLLQDSILSNVTLASLHDQLSNRVGIVKSAAALRDVLNWMARLRISARGPRSACETLSGGHQQKVLFAKFLRRSPRVLIMENPTRGVDTETKAELHRVLRTLAGEGASILLISDDLPEVIGLSDRIVVLAQGKVARVAQCSGISMPSEYDLIHMMLGGSGLQPEDFQDNAVTREAGTISPTPPGH